MAIIARSLVPTPMEQHIAHIAILVNDYDEAIDFYASKLNFELVEDTPLSPSKRWVLVKPRGRGACSLLLAKAVGDEQIAQVGHQSGGRVFLFLHTDNFDRDYQNLMAKGVHLLEAPRHEPYGKVVVFKDLYGNKWDLIEYRRAH